MTCPVMSRARAIRAALPDWRTFKASPGGRVLLRLPRWIATLAACATWGYAHGIVAAQNTRERHERAVERGEIESETSLEDWQPPPIHVPRAWYYDEIPRARRRHVD